MKKLTLTAATILFIGIIAFAYGSKERERNQQVTRNNDLNARLEWPNNESSEQDERSGELQYNIRSGSSQSITKEQLKKAKRLSDIISEYPFNWISEYVYVEISGICNGKAMKEIGSDEILNPKQMDIISAFDLNTDMVIDVNYIYKVPVTEAVEKNTMHVSMRVVPEVKAEYAGGQEQMIGYLKEHIEKFSKTTPEQFQQAMIRFTVDEEGAVRNAKVSNHTGYDRMYMGLVDAIYKMPKWKPAENSIGVKVKQDFELTVGRVGC